MALRYWNHSPDTLREVYFQLNQNALRPGSALDLLWRQAHDYDIADSDSSDWGWITIDSLAISGQAQPLESADFRYTVWRLALPAPLAPGDSLDFVMDYATQIPAAGFRNGARGKHYDVAQWYPRIAFQL